MTNFIRAANPIWWLPDLTGFPLNDQYYAFFLTNDVPYIPQAVYQDPNGNNAWTDPLQFQPSGTLPNNLYFDETKTYRIEIRQGNMSNDPLIWLIENFTPGNNVTPGDTSLLQSDNMITNPQFADINFVSPFTYTGTTTSIDVAPGWRLDLVGTGTVVLTQDIFAGISNTTGNPNYALNIQASGTWSTVQLVERFSNNGAIFSAGAIAVAFTARATGVDQTVSVQYFPSNGTSQPDIFSDQVTVGGYNAYGNAINLPVSTNNNTDGSAYVDIIFNLPAVCNIAFTNIQIVGQTSPITTGTIAPLFQQETYERTVDHEFHVYKNSLLNQPKENLLVGWTFALNPWQFRSITNSNVATNEYTADQTIVVQQNYVNSAVGNNISVGRGPAANNYAYTVTAITATNKFAIIQYIDSSTIIPYWGQVLSAMVNARDIITAPHTVHPKFKMRLIARNTSIPVISQNEPILSWLPNGEPVFAAGWIVIPPMLPLNDPEYTLSGSNQNFVFNKFQLPAATSDTMYLGVVIYTTTSMDQTAVADVILFNRVSLVPNDFAIDASTETFDESLRKCQAYYEKSYDPFTLPTTPIFVGSTTAFVPTSSIAYGLDRPFKSKKIRLPQFVWQAASPFATNSITTQFGNIAATPDVSYSSITSTGIPNLGIPINGFVTGAQWVADSRLGIF